MGRALASRGSIMSTAYASRAQEEGSGTVRGSSSMVECLPWACEALGVTPGKQEDDTKPFHTPTLELQVPSASSSCWSMTREEMAGGEEANRGEAEAPQGALSSLRAACTALRVQRMDRHGFRLCVP